MYFKLNVFDIIKHNLTQFLGQNKNGYVYFIVTIAKLVKVPHFKQIGITVKASCKN